MLRGLFPPEATQAVARDLLGEDGEEEWSLLERTPTASPCGMEGAVPYEEWVALDARGCGLLHRAAVEDPQRLMDFVRAYGRGKDGLGLIWKGPRGEYASVAYLLVSELRRCTLGDMTRFCTYLFTCEYLDEANAGRYGGTSLVREALFPCITPAALVPTPLLYPSPPSATPLGGFGG